VKTLRIALLVALPLALATVALAQVNKEEDVDIALTGQITVVDVVAKTIALQGANGERTVVGIDDKTTIMSGDKKLKIDGLHKDDWVASMRTAAGRRSSAPTSRWSTIRTTRTTTTEDYGWAGSLSP